MDKTVDFRPPATDRAFRVTGSAADRSIVGALEFGQGHYEDHVCKLLARILAPDAVCLDVGANIGVISLAIAAYAPRGRVYSFEPSRFNFAHLAKNVEQNALAHVRPVNLGAYDSAIELKFSYVEQVAGCSFASTTDVAEGTPEVIHCVALDDWVSDERLERVDFIKLDVEGAEIHALKGMQGLLARFRPGMVIEFNPVPIRRFYNEDPEVLWNLLVGLFPRLARIADDGSLEELESYAQLARALETGRGWEDLYCRFA